MIIKGSCGHIIEGITLLDSSSDDEIHQSSSACPDCQDNQTVKQGDEKHGN